MVDPAVQVGPEPAELVAAGRAALARHDWEQAYDALSRADAGGLLSGADLEGLADAAFFTAHPDEATTLKERAFARYVEEGNPVAAATIALVVARDYRWRGRMSMMSGWSRRAERLLEGLPESHAHGYLALIRSEMARSSGDLAGALAFSEEAVAIGNRTGHADLRATAMTSLGMQRIAEGRTMDGIAILEEAAISAVNGELSPFTAGVTSCTMISACRDLTDYQRASEWVEATDRWCQRQAVSGFPGICRVHRAEIVALTGAWERAEGELRRAADELTRFQAIPPLADGLYGIGDLRRLQGDFEGAEEALRQAHGLGRSPQPALALIRMATGKVRQALTAIDAAVADETADQWARSRLLAAQVEIALAAGEVARAREAADEFGRIAGTYPSPALEGMRRYTLGRVLAAEQQPDEAVRELRAAIRAWREVGAPHEVARARLALSRSLRTLGDDEDADLELRAAIDEFRRLGARPDLEAAERELARVADLAREPRTVHRAVLFTDIVRSTALAEALGDEAWGRILRWHDETLRALFGAHGGVERKQTGDGFLVTFDRAADAVAAAVAVQRALDEHGRTSGFAPPVRIGIHVGEVIERGDDVAGRDVNAASRITDLAGGGEIVATAELLAEVPDVGASELREVELRGLSAKARVATVSWRP